MDQNILTRNVNCSAHQHRCFLTNRPLVMLKLDGGFQGMMRCHQALHTDKNDNSYIKEVDVATVMSPIGL